MSRIGNRILTIPNGVTVNVDKNIVSVTGPKGTLTTNVTDYVKVTVNENSVETTRINETKPAKQMHGTANSNINNLMIGVTEGFTRSLEIIGVGYRFNVSGQLLTVNAGYSNPVKVDIPQGLTVTATGNTEIAIEGIDKILVGEFAANVRKIRQPEPYKGKGIRYKGEYVRRKEGKKASK